MLCKKFFKTPRSFSPKPSLYPSVTDNFETMKTPIQERQNHSASCITVEMTKNENVPCKWRVSRFLAQTGEKILKKNLGHEFGVNLMETGPHKPDIAYNIVSLHSLMTYNDFIDHIFVGDTETPLLRSFSFIWKFITTRQSTK